MSSLTRFLDLSLGGFHSAVVLSDGLEPRHVTGSIDIWTEMCDRRKCNDTFRSMPSSVPLTAATAGAHPSSGMLETIADRALFSVVFDIIGVGRSCVTGQFHDKLYGRKKNDEHKVSLPQSDC